MSTQRFAGKVAVVTVGALKLRGTVKTIDPGLMKRTPVANGDGSVDTHAENGIGMLEFEASCVSDSQLHEASLILEENMLIECLGRKMRFPSMTFLEASPISEEGTSTIKFGGAPSKDG